MACMNYEMDELFYKLNRRNPQLVNNVRKAILIGRATSPATSITLSQIRALYKDLTEDSFPRMGDPRIEMLFLLSIPYIAAFSNHIGTLRFYLLEEAETQA